MTQDLIEFGRIVRQTRQAAAMTVRELASRVGISYAYVSIVELGENPATNKPAKPSREIVLKLARELLLMLTNPWRWPVMSSGIQGVELPSGGSQTIPRQPWENSAHCPSVAGIREPYLPGDGPWSFDRPSPFARPGGWGPRSAEHSRSGPP